MRLLLLTCLVVLGLGVPGAAGVAGPRHATWSGLDVPYLTKHAIHFRGNSTRVDPDHVTGLTETADAAFFETAGRKGHRSLVELSPGQGAAKVVALRVQGYPIADIRRHLVTWTALRGSSARLFALDTSTGKILRGPQVSTTTRVYAVDHGTAFVADVRNVSKVRLWQPERGMALRPAPRSIAKSQQFLVDAVSGRYVVTGTDQGSERIVGAVTEHVGTGNLGVLSPSGAYLADQGLSSDHVWDVRAKRSIALTGLGDLNPERVRWTPGGALLLTAYSGDYTDPDSETMTQLVCRPAAWHCRVLPPSGVGYEEGYLSGTGSNQLLETLFVG